MQAGVLTDLLEKMEPITLEEMDSIRLMNRVDTKFVTGMTSLGDFLAIAADRYMAFTTASGRINSYDTMYYDTEDLSMYLAHHDRRLVRRKVRVRSYKDSGQTFLEVKIKNNHGRTKKKRVECDQPMGDLSLLNEAQAAFLKERSGYLASDLGASLNTAFDRITLVNNEKTERLTIDLNLRFGNPRTGTEATLPNVVIIELKQDGLKPSPAKELLREMRIHPFKVSKYCIGTALTTPGLKQNRFKAKIRRLEKIL